MNKKKNVREKLEKIVLKEKHGLETKNIFSSLKRKRFIYICV